MQQTIDKMKSKCDKMDELEIYMANVNIALNSAKEYYFTIQIPTISSYVCFKSCRSITLMYLILSRIRRENLDTVINGFGVKQIIFHNLSMDRSGPWVYARPLTPFFRTTGPLQASGKISKKNICNLGLYIQAYIQA